MNRADWMEIVSDLNGSFANGFPPDRAESFWKRYASQMPRAEFAAIMDPLVERSAMSPAPAEFRAEMDRQKGRSALPWTDVWPIAQEAAHRCGQLNANRAVLEWAVRQGVNVDGAVPRDIGTGDPGNVSAETISTMVVRARAGIVAAEWFASYGRAQILAPSASFGDETYGTRAIRVLGESYEQHFKAHPPTGPAAALGRPSVRLLDQ